MRNEFLLLTLLSLPCAAAAQDSAAPPTLQDELHSLEQRVTKLEGAPAPVHINTFNPSVGMAIDAVARGNDHAVFNLRAAELNLAAPIDPFLTGWAVITGNSGGIDVEEAAMQTTSLPHSLQLTGGRFFAPFGRLSQWHDHELPMVDRPNSIYTYVGGEAHADGLEFDWLLPTPFYLNATYVLSNNLGADNSRTDNSTPRPLDRWTHMFRLHTYADVTDDVGVDLGLTSAWTPKSTFAPAGSRGTGDSWRTLSGVDLTVRDMPSSGGMYHGVVWGTEVLQNDEQGWDPFTDASLGRVRSYSGYSNLETKVGRKVHVGGYVDMTELPSAPRMNSKTAAGYVTYEFDEFNRLRFQYSRIMDNFGGTLTSLPGTDFTANDLAGLHRGNLFMVQWTTVLGYHVHGFRGRWGT
ncbi:MAG: hypothetical protein KGL53_05050 [Elusimicrobia bacterium]|nr:hypothetical protein [Elusimicrobiota bacterium]